MIKVKNKDQLKQIINERPNNADLNDLNVSKIKDMSYLFYDSKFNGDISKWDVSKVIDMTEMFAYSEFNGDISKWDVSKVRDMSFMFEHSEFNGDISKWNVSSVVDMSYMFDGAKMKDYNFLLKWNIKNRNVYMKGFKKGIDSFEDIKKLKLGKFRRLLNI